MEEKDVVLRVQEPDPGNVGRNIITLDKQSKKILGVTSGDIAEIQGTKKTAAVIWPARDEDEGKGIIRMDNLIRKNCGSNLGEKVTVRKASLTEAKKIILAPTQDIRIIASGYERILKKNFIGRPMLKGDNVWISVFGSGFVYSVVDTTPRGIVKITDFTQFVLKEEPVSETTTDIPKVAYEDIGGIEEQIKKIREMIELPMRHPEIFRKLGINPPKGVLLHGPPGTGKTLLAKAVANETNAHFIPITSTEMLGKYVGEAEERIRKVFSDAEENAPSIIFFDEIDAIAPKRDEIVGEVEKRVVTQILSSMDGMKARGNVIVIAATNRINSLDEALRRPGRFDREIEIGVPDKKGRKEVLQIHSRGMPLAKDIDLDYFASITHGFVGADLEALTKEAAMKALRRYLPKFNLNEETIPQEVLEALEVRKNDFEEALREINPSALREVAIEIPNVKWNDVGGLESVKDELKQAVEWPLKKPHYYSFAGIKPPKGIILYGPPGTGKTLLAKAVASESEANFISVKGPELVSMWVGESEKGIRKIFKKARQVSPCIIFFDEIDAIAFRRGSSPNGAGVNDRMVNQLLTELDGIESMKDVVFIAATNRPDLVDSALLRPGRIDKLIRVPAPDEKTRKKIFAIHSKDIPIPEEKKENMFEVLASKTDGFSGADIENIIRETILQKISSKQNQKILDDFVEKTNQIKEKKDLLIKLKTERTDYAQEKIKMLENELIVLEKENAENIKKSDLLKESFVSLEDFLEAIARLKPSIDSASENAYSQFEAHSQEFRPSYVQ
ncbi:MAG: CDC48 family AAA ATPase [Candidatus Diapherotrites archaeon]|nr:CDC48 family AAA ATPase [Candidatus Diapherotrites archaeon]